MFIAKLIASLMLLLAGRLISIEVGNAEGVFLAVCAVGLIWSVDYLVKERTKE